MAIMLTFSLRSNAQEVKPIEKDSLVKWVNAYYKLNINVFQAGSAVKEIDQIFELFTSDFTYVHPKYGGVYSRQTLYDGYVRNQKNGGYDGSVVDIKIVNMIVGLNAVTVEKKFVNKNKDGSVLEGQSEMTLFEFKDNKIFKIFEYW